MKTKENVENYAAHNLGLVAQLNEQVRHWLTNETRVRPAKFVQNLRDYFRHQDKQLEHTYESARELPDGAARRRR